MNVKQMIIIKNIQISGIKFLSLLCQCATIQHNAQKTFQISFQINQRLPSEYIPTRPNNKLANENMLKKQDNFHSTPKRDLLYKQLKCVLTVNMCFGIFPVNCLGNACNKLRFRWVSWAHIYSIIISVLVLVITNMEDDPYTHHFRRINIAVKVEYLILIFMIRRLVSGKYFSLLCEIQTVDTAIMKIKISQGVKLLVFLIYISLVSIWICTTGFGIANGRTIKDIFFDTCYFYLSSTRTLIALPIIVIMCGISDRYNSLDMDLRENLFIKKLTADECLLELERLRLLHLKLCFTSEKLITRLSLLITAIFGFSYLDVLVKVGNIVSNNEFNYCLDPLIIGFNMIVCYSVICASEQLHQASRSVLYTLQGLPLLNKPDPFYIMVEQFTLLVGSSNIQESASKFFLLSKKAVPAMFGSMASFIVLVIQLAPK